MSVAKSNTGRMPELSKWTMRSLTAARRVVPIWAEIPAMDLFGAMRLDANSEEALHGHES